MAAMLAHEVKNPLSGIRGAAQLLEQSVPSQRARAHPADLRGDRPHRRAGRPHGGVRRQPADRARRRSTSTRCSNHVRTPVAQRLRHDTCASSRSYDPSLPPVLGDRDQLIQVFLNLVKNAAEVPPATASGEIELSTAYQHGAAPRGAGPAGAGEPAAGGVGARQRPRRAGRDLRATCSTPSSPTSRPARASALRWSPR